MTPLFWILHQVAKIIIYRNFFYIRTLILIKTNYNAFSMTSLSRLMHQVTIIILHLNFFYIYTSIVIKTTEKCILMTLLSRIMHQVAKTTRHRNIFNIYIYRYKKLLITTVKNSVHYDKNTVDYCLRNLDQEPGQQGH